MKPYFTQGKTLALIAVSYMALSLGAPRQSGAQQYSTISRITNQGGSFEFLPQADGKILIRVSDAYGTRTVGFPKGYDEKGFASLEMRMRRRGSKVLCYPLRGLDYVVTGVRPLSVIGVASDGWTGARGLSTAVKLTASAIELSRYAVASILLHTFAEMCRETEALNKTSLEMVKSKRLDLQGNASVKFELNNRDYWNLYDLIDEDFRIHQEADGFAHMWGASESPTKEAAQPSVNAAQ